MTRRQNWPPGMRVIARRERPHPGAQLRLTDHNGWRITCFATNTPTLGGLAAGRPGSPAPATRPLRGPHPRPEGHRATEPALPRLRPEPDLGRDRRTRCRPARLDPDPRLRPARARPPMGAQTAPVPDPRRRRTHHPHRPPKTPPAPQGLALEPTHRHRLARTPHHLKPHHDPHTRQDPENRRHQRRANTPAPPVHPNDQRRKTFSRPARRKIEARCRTLTPRSAPARARVRVPRRHGWPGRGGPAPRPTCRGRPPRTVGG